MDKPIKKEEEEQIDNDEIYDTCVLSSITEMFYK